MALAKTPTITRHHMIRINEIKLPLDHEEGALLDAITKSLALLLRKLSLLMSLDVATMLVRKPTFTLSTR